MKIQLIRFITALGLCVCWQEAAAQGTAFTYQGQLQNNGSPANGYYDFEFSLSKSPSGGSQIGSTITNIGVGVSDGLFTVTLDFGPVFTGNDTWLAINVRSNAVGGYTALAPLQELNPTPYAIFANTTSNISGTVPASQLTGTISPAQLPSVVVSNNATNLALNGVFTGNGGGLTNLFAWQLLGNTGTSNGNFLGTTDNQPLEIRVNGVRAGYLSPSNGSPNIVFGPTQNVISNGTAGSSILGGSNNIIAPGSSFSAIGGGVANIISNSAPNSYIAGGQNNSILFGANLSVISGGEGNTIQSFAAGATIAGGQGNDIYNSAGYSFIGGGNDNIIYASASFSTIAGGAGNSIETSAQYSFLGGGGADYIYAPYSVLGGGNLNQIQSGSSYSFVGGGYDDDILGAAPYSAVMGGYLNHVTGASYSLIGGGYGNSVTGSYATIPGGSNNLASGQSSFAAGTSAQAVNNA